jgi:glutathione S-transferase
MTIFVFRPPDELAPHASPLLGHHSITLAGTGLGYDRSMSVVPYIFYGDQISLYSGKVRSYLRKKRLPFEERKSPHPGFGRVCKRLGIHKQPVLETPEGELVQDTTEIIDFLEARHPEGSVYPKGPCQRLIALILELFGDEGLIKPAMHYRWNFPEENDPFLIAEFSKVGAGDGAFSSVRDGRERAVALCAFMRSTVVPALGVTPASVPAIEAAYEDLLDGLQGHFDAVPYLLGGRPCIGDFGLIAPLYAHLGRDPYPSGLMKRRAPAVNRWVERMNVADSNMAEFAEQPPEFLPGDEIPETLLPILELMARDYLPELASIVDHVNTFFAEHPESAPGSPIPASTQAMGTAAPLGHHTVELRGRKLDLALQHYSLWMLQRVLDHYDSLEPDESSRVRHIMGSIGLAPLVTTRPHRRIDRVDGVEVFG